MLKKIFLLVTLFLNSFEMESYYSKKESDSFLLTNGQIITGIVLTSASLATAVYLFKRETNDSVVARSKLLIIEASELITSVKNSFYNKDKSLDEYTLSLLENKTLLMKNKVDQLASTVSGRYESYIAFWNWKDNLKEVHTEFKKIQKNIDECLYEIVFKKTVNFILKYQKLIEDNIELFADNKSFFNLLESNTRILKKNIFEILQNGKNIKNEYLCYAKNLNSVDRKIEYDLDMILEQAFFMQTVLAYDQCILAVDSENLLMKNVRKAVGLSSSYPIKDFVEKLRSDIQVLIKMSISSEPYAQNSIEILRSLLEEVISSTEYSKEKQAYEIFKEEQRKTRAEEDKARAAQEVAEAEKRKAYEMHKKNQIEKERNDIERERNNIERERNKKEKNK